MNNQPRNKKHKIIRHAGFALLITMLVAIFTGKIAYPEYAQGSSRVILLSTTGTKDPIRGLEDSGYGNTIPPTNYINVVRATALQVNWSDLQPTQNGPIVTNNLIDQTIAQVRQLNAATPGLNFRIKLRIMAGKNAPPWAQNIGGPSFKITDPQGGAHGMIGRFWTLSYEQAYADLETKLAALYDNVPEISEVTTSGCSTIFDEPFIRQAVSQGVPQQTNIQAYFDAGFTVALDQGTYDAQGNLLTKGCQQTEIDTMASAWKHTNVELSFNTYQKMGYGGMPGSGTEAPDETFT